MEATEPEEIVSDSLDDDVKDLLKKFEAEYEALRRRKQRDKAKGSTPKLTTTTPSARPLPTHPFAADAPQSPPLRFLTKLYQAARNDLTTDIDYAARIFAWDIATTTKIDDATPLTCNLTRIRLRRRFYAEKDLESLVTQPDIKLLSVNKLLAKCNPGNRFTEPQYTNWALTGIITYKLAAPRLTTANVKYFKAKVGDYNHQVEVMFFGAACDKYWRLQPGDAVWVLNPSVNRYTLNGKLGFTLHVDELPQELVLVIGAAADFGRCKGFNQSAQAPCTEAVDLLKLEMCAYHIDQRLRHSQSQRLELRGLVMLRDPTMAAQQRRLNDYNELTTVYHGVSRDRDKYDMPIDVDREVARRRKARDDRANRELEQRLRHASVANPARRTLTMIKTPPRPKHQPPTTPPLRGLPQRGFLANMVKQIGYNPVVERHPHDDVYLSPKRKRTHDIQQLYELLLAKLTEKQLDLLPQDKRHKRQKWLANMLQLRLYQSRLQTSADKLHQVISDSGTPKGPPPSSSSSSSRTTTSAHLVSMTGSFTSTNGVVGMTNELSDDSDFEIEFTSEDAKKDFQQRIGALRKQK